MCPIDGSQALRHTVSGFKFRNKLPGLRLSKQQLYVFWTKFHTDGFAFFSNDNRHCRMGQSESNSCFSQPPLVTIIQRARPPWLEHRPESSGGFSPGKTKLFAQSNWRDSGHTKLLPPIAYIYNTMYEIIPPLACPAPGSSPTSPLRHRLSAYESTHYPQDVRTTSLLVQMVDWRFQRLLKKPCDVQSGDEHQQLPLIRHCCYDSSSTLMCDLRLHGYDPRKLSCLQM